MIKNVYGESAAMIPDDQQSVYDWGVIDERERIIKLLKDYSDGEILVLVFSEIASLIIGENE